MASMHKRLQKELLAIQKEPPPGVRVNPETIGPSLTHLKLHKGLFNLEVPFNCPLLKDAVKSITIVCPIGKPNKQLFNSKRIPNRWTVEMEGAVGTLYEGEKFQLLFKFSPKYPFDSPEVTFIGPNIPVHPHVYSNGHICLSILTEDWSPALSVQSVCLSIVSMLSSCKEKKRPPDNTLYVKTCSKNPKKTRWWYHDDSV